MHERRHANRCTQWAEMMHQALPPQPHHLNGTQDSLRFVRLQKEATPDSCGRRGGRGAKEAKGSTNQSDDRIPYCIYFHQQVVTPVMLSAVIKP